MDIQSKLSWIYMKVGHRSYDSANLMYWKETKNFENGCSTHISGSFFADGNVALPDQSIFIIECWYFQAFPLQYLFPLFFHFTTKPENPI